MRQHAQRPSVHENFVIRLVASASTCEMRGEGLQGAEVAESTAALLQWDRASGLNKLVRVVVLCCDSTRIGFRACVFLVLL